MFNRVNLARPVIARLLVIVMVSSLLVAVDIPYVYAATTVKIAHAAHGEKGTSGCVPGDQTGNEVCIRSWTYKTSSSSGFHWNAILRCDDPAVAARIANTAVKACNNPHVGYDKGTVAERQSFYKALVAANWDASKITTDVETSCSPFACACINAGFKRQYIKTDHSCTTLYKTLKNDPLFTCYTASEVCSSDIYLKPGDILITTGRHCAIVVEQKGNPVDPPGSNTNVTLATGQSYILTANLRVRSGAGTNYPILKYESLTEEDKVNAVQQSGDAVLKSGTQVKCGDVRGNWIKISSGWICGKEGKSNYVKAVPTSTASTATTTSTTVEIQAGKDYVLTKALYVRKGPGKNYAIKKRSSLSASAKRFAKIGTRAMFKKGTVVTCLKRKGDWMKIPSGWICCKKGNVKPN